MTIKQQQDIETCEHFIPSGYKHISITNEDRQRFLASSERGTEKWNSYQGVHDGFDALSLGKSRRGLHIDLWEQGVLEGTHPYFTLLGGEDTPIPVAVKDFMKKEMFKGMDAETIEDCYQTILKGE